MVASSNVRPGPAPTRVCIYCLEEKPDSAFNREHVVHQAFGHFRADRDDGFVLTCVCEACNTFFANGIDLKFTRDSIEAFFRFHSGAKSTAEYKSLGRRSTTTVEFREGDNAGITGYLCPNPDGGPELRVEPFPRIGFSHTKDGEKTWFTPEKVPTREELVAHGYPLKDGYFLHTRGMFTGEAKTLLEPKGYVFTHDFDEFYPPDTLVATTTKGVIGRPEKRAAAKILMNYLADRCGSALARSAQLNAVRDFVRYDRGEVRPVHVSRNTFVVLRQGQVPAKGHYIALEMRPNGFLMGQLSIFQQLRYLVQFNSVPFVFRTRVAHAHFFDTELLHVKPIAMPPWNLGEPLIPVADES